MKTKPQSKRMADARGMNRFAELLNRLAYEPARNAKLRLITDYFRSTPDPERGWALAALTGALSFPHAKAGLIRSLIAERTDPVLFELSYDYVGDLSETVALMWPISQIACSRRNEQRDTTCLSPPSSKRCRRSARRNCRKQLAQWLDALDETGRWALIKLVTGGLRIGVSARLAKAAVGALGDKDAQDIELLWPGLAPPYRELFAWLEGRGDKPASTDPAPFRPPMLAHALDDADLAELDAADFMAEWKWDGIRVQAVAAQQDERAGMVARLYSRTGEDISKSFPDLLEALHLPGAIDGELLIMRDGACSRSTCCSSGSTAKPSRRSCSPNFRRICAPTICLPTAARICASCPLPSAASGWRPSLPGSTIRGSIFRR